MNSRNDNMILQLLQDTEPVIFIYLFIVYLLAVVADVKSLCASVLWPCFLRI